MVEGERQNQHYSKLRKLDTVPYTLQTQLNLSVTVLSFLAAFVFSMLIEAPTLGLEKAILGKILRKKH